MNGVLRILAAAGITTVIVVAANAQTPAPPAPAVPTALPCESRLAQAESQLKVVLKHDQNLQNRSAEADVKIASLETQVAELNDRLREASSRAATIEAEKAKAAASKPTVPTEAKK